MLVTKFIITINIFMCFKYKKPDYLIINYYYYYKQRIIMEK